MGSHARYFSIFALLERLNICEDGNSDIYGPHFATFYNRFVGREVTDIPVYERYLPPGGRVLDLACGAGRIGIALARTAAQVDGIDLSPDMLSLVAANLSSEQPDVADRFRCFEGDITRLQLTHRYDLVLLGATSLSLILRPEQRQSLFERVRDHLTSDGRFVFDILNLRGDRWKELDGYIDVWSHESDDGQEFAIVGQQFHPEEGTFTFNVYREVIGWDGATKRYLGTSTKAWLQEEHVEAALEKAGLKLLERFPHGGSLFFVTVKE